MLGKTIAATVASQFMFACVTVPKDAPEEFKSAEASVEKLDNIDADDYFPKSVERADNYFNEAVYDLRNAKTESEKVAATQKALWARETADDTATLVDKVKSWDRNSTNMTSGLAALETQDTVAVAIIEPSESLANLEGSEVVSTVAYFPTGNDSNPAISRAELDSLVSILETNESYQVVLTGFADKRGSADRNEKLAYERAKTIAKELEKRGIDPSQMVVESGGEESSVREGGKIANLQLERKVQAKVKLR